jgi:hypothetical protein
MPVGAYTPTSALGNGATTVFAYTFRIFQAADMQVLLDGVVQTSGYTVSGINSPAGGSVTFSTAPAASVVVKLQRAMSYDRATDYQESGDLQAQTLDDDLDRAVMLIQQLRDILSRTPTLADGSTLSGAFGFPAPVSDGVIKYNTAATALEATAFSAILPTEVAAVSAFMETVLDDGSAKTARETLHAGRNMVAKTANFTVAADDGSRTFLCDATSGAITATMPSAATAQDGFEVSFLKVDTSTNGLTIAGTINGGTNLQIAAQWQRVTIRCNGSAFYVVDEDDPDAEFDPLWNGELYQWSRGTTFTIPAASNSYTADRTIIGSGTGGAVSVNRFAFDPGQTEVPGDPRYYLQTSWTTGPTAGEARTGYPDYFSVLEIRTEDVRKFSGRPVTLSFWARGPLGAVMPFYAYVSQGLGGGGSHGQTGNTISGTSAGIDYNFSAAEIFTRSAVQSPGINTTGFKLYTITLDVPALPSGSTIGSDNVLTFGLGADFGAIGIEIFEFAQFRVNAGRFYRAPRRQHQADIRQRAKSYHQRFGPGVCGVAITASRIECSISFAGELMRSPSVSLLDTTPQFRVAGTNVVGVASTIVSATATTLGASVIIDGFSGLTAGDGAVFNEAGDLLQIAVE